MVTGPATYIGLCSLDIDSLRPVCVILVAYLIGPG